MAKSFARSYGSLDRVEWCRNQPCVVSGTSPCENHHTASGGTGRKAGYETIIPLSPLKHRELHRIGVKTFQTKYGVDLAAAAAATQKRWVEANGGTDPCVPDDQDL